MDVNDPLFELIKTLSPNEKGYFKKNSFIGKDANYLLLFDTINSLTEYNEGSIIKKIKNSSIAKNYSQSKKYLYDSILESLIHYNKEKNIEAKLNDSIESIKILFDKGLHDQCEKLIAQSIELAQKNQLYMHLIQINSFVYTYNQFKLKSNKEHFELQSKTIRQLEQINLSNKWYIDILNWVQKNDKAKTKQEKDEITQLFQANEILMNPEISFKTLNTYYSGETIYHYAFDNMKEAVLSKIKQLNSYIDNKVMREVNYKTFLLVYGNVLSMLYNNKDIEQFENYYTQFNSYLVANSNHKVQEKEIEYSHGIGRFTLSKKYSEALPYITSIEKELTEIISRFSPIRAIDVRVNIAIIYFWNKEYKTALKWLHEIINGPQQTLYQYTYVRLIELIIHIELGNIDLLKSRAQSTYRFLEQRNKIYDFENVMLTHLKKMLGHNSKKNRKDIFKSLKNELELLKQDKTKASAFEHFDYIKWIDNQLNIN